MSAISLTGNDTISINNRVLNAFVDQNIAELTFPNDIAQVKTGKNGNSIYALNTTGRQCELKLRLLRGSSDDQFLNALLQSQNNAFAQTVLLIGEFVKQIGDGQGNVLTDTYIMSGGVFTKQVEVKSNVEGDTEQSVAIYMIKFSNSPRAIG